jgi:hypothetical protein
VQDAHIAALVIQMVEHIGWLPKKKKAELTGGRSGELHLLMVS